MDRRAFITMRRIGLTVVFVMSLAFTLVSADAPQGQKMYRIGFLGLTSAADYAENLQAFRQGLRDLGYEEGRNISIDYRWAQGRVELLHSLAAELVRLNPDVLVTHASGISAAQQATTTIPIVIGAHSDPVRLGLVKSLARPGGNTTGVSSQI